MNPKTYLSIFAIFIILSSTLTLKTLKTNKMALSKSMGFLSNQEYKELFENLKNEYKKDSSNYYTNQQFIIEHLDVPINYERKNVKCLDEVQKFTRAKTEFLKIGSHSYSDLGVNPGGLVVTAGIDGGVYEFKFTEERFEEILTDIRLEISRLDINYNGIIYAITKCGDTYYLTYNGKWIKLPGCAIDLGVGRAGEVLKIGCKKYSADLEILNNSNHKKSSEVFRLVCDNQQICPKCKLFVKRTFNCDKDENIGTCHWIRLPKFVTLENTKKIIPEFKRIDVNPLGNPVVTDGDNIYEYDGEKSEYIKLFENTNKYNINDVTSDNYGNTLFVDGNNTFIIKKGTSVAKEIEKLVEEEGEKTLLNISASAYAQPQLIVKIKKNKTNYYHFFTSSKLSYNRKE